MGLSKRRAHSVEKEFIGQGIEKERLQVSFFGPTRPIDAANNRKAWAKETDESRSYSKMSLYCDPLLAKLAPLKAEPGTLVEEN